MKALIGLMRSKQFREEENARQTLISFIKNYVLESEIPDIDLDELIEWCQEEQLAMALERFQEYCEETGFVIQ